MRIVKPVRIQLTEWTKTLTRFRPSGGVSAGRRRICPAPWLRDKHHPYPSHRADAHTGVAPSPSAPPGALLRSSWAEPADSSGGPARRRPGPAGGPPSFEGPDVDARGRCQDRSPDPHRGRRRQQLPDHRPPRRLRRSRPGDPQLELIDPRRTAVQERKQAAQTDLLPLRIRRSGRPGLPGLLRQEDHPGQAPHPGPCSASPDAGPTSSSSCSATEPSTNCAWPQQSADLWRCQQYHLVGLHIEPKHRVASLPVTLGRQHHWPAQSTPDRTKKPTQHVEPRLSLQLPQIHVKTDLVSRLQPKDRQHIRHRPDPHIRALGISRPRQHLSPPRCVRTRHRPSE